MEQNQQQPNQQPNQTSIDEQRRQKSKRIKITLLALAAVLIVIGGILLLKATQPAPSPQSPGTSDFTLSEVEGWQTYRNAEFGFEFKYAPEEWQLMEGIAEEDYSNIVWLFPRDSIGESSESEIIVSIAHRSLEQEKEKREAFGDLEYNYSKVTIGGRTAYSSALLPGFHGQVREILIDARNGQTFIVSSNAIDALDQILSTFRFVKDDEGNDKILTPEEVLSNLAKYHGQEIEVHGVIELIPFVDSFGLGGAAPGFKTELGNLTVSNWDRVNDAARKKSEVIVRGVLDDVNYSAFLSFPSDCIDCFVNVTPQP